MLKPASIRPVARACASQSTRRTFLSRARDAKRASSFASSFDTFNAKRLGRARSDYDTHRRAFLLAGAVSGTVMLVYFSLELRRVLAEQSEKRKRAEREGGAAAAAAAGGSVKMEAPGPVDLESESKRKVVLHDGEGRELVPTGNSVVQFFPRLLDVAPPGAKPSEPAVIKDDAGTEYTLVGLGLRTVTLFGIQVYVVGFYVATQDIARLQSHLVKRVNSIATTLVPSERDALRRDLLDPAEGEEIWGTILRDVPVRTVFRIVPTRDTDLHHLRDGFVRGIQARSQGRPDLDGRSLAESVSSFKQSFGRGPVHKGKEMLLCRDAGGALTVLFGDGRSGRKRQVMGGVEDRRISDLLWLNYLAGKKVASEPARQNIVLGIMEFVERPIGTVATQVV